MRDKAREREREREALGVRVNANEDKPATERPFEDDRQERETVTAVTWSDQID